MVTDPLRLPKAHVGRQFVPADQQSRHLLIALALLVFVLVITVAKNSDFWFGSTEVADADSTTSTDVSAAVPLVAPSKKAEALPEKALPEQTAVVKFQHPSRAASKPAETKTAQPVEPAEAAPVVATNRVVLPPMDVEVIAGDKHSTIRPGNNAMVAQFIDANHPAVSHPAANLPVNAAEIAHVPVPAAPELRTAVEATYPLLAQRSRVQGSVVLEAVIGADGGIENLRVLSGPSILSTAAQQAVRQWRFKPYVQNGQPVETKCKVTVNFSIHFAENSPSAG
jgi:TonB family protein